jgi:hypothetical protein
MHFILLLQKKPLICTTLADDILKSKTHFGVWFVHLGEFQYCFDYIEFLYFKSYNGCSTYTTGYTIFCNEHALIMIRLYTLMILYNLPDLKDMFNKRVTINPGDRDVGRVHVQFFSLLTFSLVIEKVTLNHRDTCHFTIGLQEL